MPSSADPVEVAITRAVREVDAARSRLLSPGTPGVILIDGRSGSGKTTLAARLRQLWREPVHVIALDELYPGWDGLAKGARIVQRDILLPYRAGEPVCWRRWDWVVGAAGAEVKMDADALLIVEGSGVLTRASAPLAEVSVWLDSPERSRRERAIARDGATYVPHWEGWAAQEAEHVATNDPATLATIVIEVP